MLCDHHWAVRVPGLSGRNSACRKEPASSRRPATMSCPVRWSNGHYCMPPAILLTNPCFTAPWSDAFDANDNIWTCLGQDIARVESAHCHSVPWGHLRSVTSDNLTFTSNHIICDYNRFLRWWIRFEGWSRYTNNMCLSGRGSVTS